MIYKIMAIIAILSMGLAMAYVVPEKPSELIIGKEKPGIVNLSGADFNKIFSNPSMQLAPLGLPPKGYASDMKINPAFTLQSLINWANEEPAPLVSLSVG